VDRDAFDDIMASLDSPMVVVTAATGRERAGCLVGFHVQCSIEPPRYAVWLSKANHTCRVALHSRHLAVHFLTPGDRELAELFGTTSGDELDKFSRCEWGAGEGGVPLLEVGGGRVVGRRTAFLDEGSDHICFVVEPLEAERGPRFAAGARLRLSDVSDLEPGHPAADRPVPAAERPPDGT
jgi:flavin reductase (DIM6/NTAB) family NADH-FMN oxidoreductase RutF